MVGLPVSLDGAEGEQAADGAGVRATSSRRSSTVPVETYDERLTTRMAERSARAGAQRPAGRARGRAPAGVLPAPPRGSGGRARPVIDDWQRPIRRGAGGRGAPPASRGARSAAARGRASGARSRARWPIARRACSRGSEEGGTEGPDRASAPPPRPAPRRRGGIRRRATGHRRLRHGHERRSARASLRRPPRGPHEHAAPTGHRRRDRAHRRRSASWSARRPRIHHYSSGELARSPPPKQAAAGPVKTGHDPRGLRPPRRSPTRKKAASRATT